MPVTVLLVPVTVPLVPVTVLLVPVIVLLQCYYSACYSADTVLLLPLQCYYSAVTVPVSQCLLQCC